MKRILHATDYSENAIPALNYAFNISKKLNASLFVIHVYDSLPLGLDGEKNNKHLNILTEFCEKHYDGDIEELDISFDAIEDKSIVHAILKKSYSLNADLIISGTKSEKVIKELLLSNKAKQLIEKAPCPVLTVPKEQNEHKIDTIVYASDFEENDISAIYDLVSIAKPYDAFIKIVHISVEEDEAEIKKMDWFTTLLNEKIEYNKIDIEIIYSQNIFDSLKAYIKKENADMVTMLERNSKGFVNMLFHIDLVKKMETLADIPLMSFNENRLK
jgi:nucleotide-binding universal stress UspA family protein